MRVIEMKDFPVVTMDSHRQSKHVLLDESSQNVLDNLLARPYSKLCPTLPNREPIV